MVWCWITQRTAHVTGNTKALDECDERTALLFGIVGNQGGVLVYVKQGYVNRGVRTWLGLVGTLVGSLNNSQLGELWYSVHIGGH